MNFLIFILAFVMAVDENTLTRVLHRPLCACTLFGAVLGNPLAGLAAGGVLELAAVGFDTAVQTNYIPASLIAALLAVNGTDAAASAAGGAVFFIAGYLLKEAVSLICAAVLPSARKAAENRKEGGLLTGVIISAVLYGLVFGAVSMWTASMGASAAETLGSILESNGWILSILQTAAALAGAIGIAVLYRNLGGNKIPGAFLGGAACCALLVAVGLSNAAALLCGFAAFAAAGMDFHLRADKNEKPAEKKEVKKGGAQWW